MRAMARAEDGEAALVEIKAVDGRYPLAGEATVEPKKSLATAFVPDDGAHGAVADEALLIRLGISTGDTIRVGDARLRISGVLTKEPDKLALGMGLAPRLLLSQAGLQATGIAAAGQRRALDLSRAIGRSFGRVSCQPHERGTVPFPGCRMGDAYAWRRRAAS